MMWILSLLFWCLFQEVIVENTVVSRVYGGDDVRPIIHKHLVKLDIQTDILSSCSGSIIDANWVVTSAHCLSGEDEEVTALQDVLGVKKLIAKIKRVYLHPKYVRDAYHALYDVAVLKTRKPIKFTDNIQPIELAIVNPKVGQSAIIAGYGLSENPNKITPKEGVVEVTGCPDSSDSMLCSKDIVRAGSGDSGGPLVSKGRLVGVTSGSCKNVKKKKKCLTVYASVAFNKDWILNVTKI